MLLGSLDLEETLVNLMIAMVGSVNKSVTDLQTLENNKFETANFRNKSLIVITDSQQYRGKVAILKAITGGDPIRNEQKHKDPGMTFTANCLIVMASNELLLLGDYSTGLTRRRIIKKFSKPIVDKKVMLDKDVNGNFVGYLADELGSFFNLIIKMDLNEVNLIWKSIKFLILVFHYLLKEFYQFSLNNYHLFIIYLFIGLV